MIDKNILKTCHGEGFKEDDVFEAYKIFFGTLVSEPRIKIINSLRKKEKNVSELIEELEMDQTAISHNLSRLKKCGFVYGSRDGKFVYYALNEATVRPLMDLIDKHMQKHCIHILKELKEKSEKSKSEIFSHSP